jgi:hypothetical protein
MNLPPLADCRDCGNPTRARDPYGLARCEPCQRLEAGLYRFAQLGAGLSLRWEGFSAGAQAAQIYPLDAGAPRPFEFERGRP